MEQKEADLMKYARGHYENFPVVTWLVPAEYRTDIAAVYWFARIADDLADEGDYSVSQRLDMLDQFEERFRRLPYGNFESHYEKLLSDTIKKRDLSTGYFVDLLSAFRQDVVKTRYNNYYELLDYCRRSANPVGRLLLELLKIRDEEAIRHSDEICTALQLTNFYQDTGIDIDKGRIYFPIDEIKYYGAEEKSFENKKINDNLKQLVRFSIERTENLFSEGRKLLPFLKGRFRIEIAWTIEGGLRILKKIKKNGYNIFERPVLSPADFAVIFLKSLFR